MNALAQNGVVNDVAPDKNGEGTKVSTIFCHFKRNNGKKDYALE